MSDFTFLTYEQCFGSDEDGNEKLDILEKRGVNATVTDFSVLLGVDFTSYYTNSDDPSEGRKGYYWTKSDDGDGVAAITDDEGCDNYFTNTRKVGGRPALAFSSTYNIPTNGVSGKKTRDGILEVEYGYYPQQAVSKEMQDELEEVYRSGRLSKTGKGYTTDSKRNDDYDKKFEPKRHEEYQYNGKRYVRVETERFKAVQLSNGKIYGNGDNVWVEVSPVKWLVDEKARIMLAEKIIFAGVQFNHTREYRTEDFDKTDIKTFMDMYFAPELEQSRETISLGEQQEEIGDTETRKSRLQTNIEVDEIVRELRGKIQAGEVEWNREKLLDFVKEYGFVPLGVTAKNFEETRGITEEDIGEKVFENNMKDILQYVTYEIVGMRREKYYRNISDYKETTKDIICCIQGKKMYEISLITSYDDDGGSTGEMTISEVDGFRKVTHLPREKEKIELAIEAGGTFICNAFGYDCCGRNKYDAMGYAKANDDFFVERAKITEISQDDLINKSSEELQEMLKVIENENAIKEARLEELKKIEEEAEIIRKKELIKLIRVAQAEGKRLDGILDSLNHKESQNLSGRRRNINFERSLFYDKQLTTRKKR